MQPLAVSAQLLQRFWRGAALQPAHQLALQAALTAGRAQFGTTTAAAAAAQPLPTRDVGVVPPGHLSSDLSPTVCHIGLGRRRDLTLRQDLVLYVDGKKQSLGDIFKGLKVIVVSFPGGPVCTEKHIPGYVEMEPALERKGVDAVLCVTPDSAEAVQQLALQQPKLTSRKVKLAADPSGSFIRLLGLELGAGATAAGPKCQRFAGIVENGVLLKVKVEASPADLKQTDARSMCALWEDVYGHLQHPAAESTSAAA